VEPNLYLVSFEWTSASAGDAWGMHYEEDIENRYVRPVMPDDPLAIKYRILSQEGTRASKPKPSRV
jgi:hypothetical protein